MQKRVKPHNVHHDQLFSTFPVVAAAIAVVMVMVVTVADLVVVVVVASSVMVC